MAAASRDALPSNEELLGTADKEAQVLWDYMRCAPANGGRPLYCLDDICVYSTQTFLDAASLQKHVHLVHGSGGGGGGGPSSSGRASSGSESTVDPCLVPTVLPRGRTVDCIFVLGNQDLRTAEHAAHLYNEGVAPLIVFTGGRGHGTEGWDEEEAVVMARVARERGVPEEAIIVEPRATNTGENIKFSQTLLRAWADGQDGGGVGGDGGGAQRRFPRTFVLVQKPYMLRRSWNTFSKQWQTGGGGVDGGGEQAQEQTAVTFYVSGPAFPEFAAYVGEGTMGREVVVNQMVGDVQRCMLYGDVLGFQTREVDVPTEVLVALARLVGQGYVSHLAAVDWEKRRA